MGVDNEKVAELLDMCEDIAPVALDVVLQYALGPELDGEGGLGFGSSDPHAVVGAYVRRLIRVEPVDPIEYQRAMLALVELPRLGEEEVREPRKRRIYDLNFRQIDEVTLPPREVVVLAPAIDAAHGTAALEALAGLPLPLLPGGAS